MGGRGAENGAELVPGTFNLPTSLLLTQGKTMQCTRDALYGIAYYFSLLTVPLFPTTRASTLTQQNR